MAILRYLILVVALVGMGISTYAQRQIEWYEPDFDSVYRDYWMGFGKHVGGDFVHFYQFWSPTAKSNRIKSILKRKEFKRTSSQHFVEQIEYNQDGFLTHTCYRSFRKTKFGLDTSFVCAEYEIFPSKSGTQITRYYVLSKQNDFLGDTVSYYFNCNRQLDSMVRGGKSRYYYYDLAGRLTAIKHQRGIDSFICKPFNKHVDDVLHNSDEIVRSRTEGIWPEDVLRFIQDSSSSGNRQRIFKKDAIGGDAPRFDLLKTNGFVFSKKLRRRVGELSSVDEFAMFLREERDRMIEYSYYIKFGSSAEFIQTTYAVRKRNKWLVRLTNKSYSYRIPISVMPKRISFPHFRYHFKYEFFD